MKCRLARALEVEPELPAVEHLGQGGRDGSGYRD
jgi:hypothetical protein